MPGSVGRHSHTTADMVKRNPPPRSAVWPPERQPFGLPNRPEPVNRTEPTSRAPPVFSRPDGCCRWIGCRKTPQTPASLREHLVTHIPRVEFPFNCEWEACGKPLSSRDEGVNHLIRWHLQYDGRLDALPVRKLVPSSRPCRWHGCEYRVSKDAVVNMAKHAVSAHVNRRSQPNVSRACEWEGCGEIFITARLLADHLTVIHARFFGPAVICYCGELIGKSAVKAHENSCAVQNNLLTPPATTITIESDPPSTRAQKRDHSDSEYSPQPIANEPRKIKNRRTTFIDLSHNDPPVEMETSPEPPDESPDDDQSLPGPKASRGSQSVAFPTLEQQQRMDEEMMRKRAEERGKRRLEYKQQKEQQQEPKTQDLHASPHRDQHHQETPKTLDPRLTPRTGSYETPQPGTRQTDTSKLKRAQDAMRLLVESFHNPEHQPKSIEADMVSGSRHRQPDQPSNPDQDSALTAPTSGAPADTPQSDDPLAGTDEQQNAVGRVIALADKLQGLSDTIRAAVQVLPASYIEGLNYELGNDWAVDEMRTMVEGVIKVYGYGGNRGWTAGDEHPQWNTSTRQQQQQQE
ncbi:hypothetical protein BZA05DRAFT_406334 [Tricharina praecox]|uniref:uncharacterized protein n=1 Tax=Tricharina praecox TaxID=43433 RepID=UPI00221FF20B|nr:uncharacterized protein BZA05DRAFT_406334 [Tricharina praecox]KAI5846698.1 hypothetical protein BZA05DRAFT_406334 [Tricharina praecox]